MGEIWGYYQHTINAILTVKQANYKDRISTPQHLTGPYLCWFLTPRQWNRINPRKPLMLLSLNLFAKENTSGKQGYMGKNSDC